MRLMPVRLRNGERGGHRQNRPGRSTDKIIDLKNTPPSPQEFTKYGKESGLLLDGWARPENSQGGVLNNKIMTREEAIKVLYKIRDLMKEQHRSGFVADLNGVITLLTNKEK